MRSDSTLAKKSNENILCAIVTTSFSSWNMAETRRSKKIIRSKAAERKRKERASKVLTDEQKAKIREDNRLAQQKRRAKLSNREKAKIYRQQYEYKKGVWLESENNRKKNIGYTKASKTRRANYRAHQEALCAIYANEK